LRIWRRERVQRTGDSAKPSHRFG